MNIKGLMYKFKNYSPIMNRAVQVPTKNIHMKITENRSIFSPKEGKESENLNHKITQKNVNFYEILSENEIYSEMQSDVVNSSEMYYEDEDKRKEIYLLNNNYEENSQPIEFNPVFASTNKKSEIFEKSSSNMQVFNIIERNQKIYENPSNDGENYSESDRKGKLNGQSTGLAQSRSKELESRTEIFQLNMDFIILSLKNDLRVKSFKYSDEKFKISFWNVEDSISFYKQYFKIVEMDFSVGNDDYQFMVDDHEKTNNFDSIFNNIDNCTKISQSEAVEMKKETQIVFLDNSESNKRIKTHHPLRDQLNSKDSDEEIILKSNSSFIPNTIYNKTEINLENKKSKKEEKRYFSTQSMMNNNLISKNIVKSCGKSKKDEFNSRVEYFHKMRNFYSKNDVKKMESSLRSRNFDFLYINSKEIACGCFSNIVMQEALKIMKEDEKRTLIKNLGHDISAIASTKYGAYSVQSIIMFSESKETQRLLSSYFERYGEYLFAHAIGNYAIQKVLRFDEELVFDLFMKNIKEILEDDLGIRVFKKSLFLFENKREIIIKALNDIEDESNRGKCEALISALKSI